MQKRTKRILFSVLGVVVVIVAVPFVAFGITMAGDSPIQDGEALGAHAKQLKDGYVSFGVVDIGDGGVALVDCGDDKAGKAVAAELERRKLQPEAVKAIFITHGHADHVGACFRYPKADVYAMAAEQPIIEGKESAKGLLPRMMGPHDSGARVTHAMRDGEVVTVGDLDVTAFALPGHTQGSAVYFIDGVVYFGDGASADKDGHVTPPKYLFSDDQKQGIESLKALAKKLEPRKADVKTLEFAHTGTLSGFEPLAAFATSH